MPGFLYYLPGKNTATTADVQAAGIGYAFEGEVKSRGCRGPDGDNGCVVAVTTDGLGYHPERQTWRKVPGSVAWVGYANEAKPGPNDLARKNPLQGRVVELGDRQKWLIPVAREYREEDGQLASKINIPRTLDVNENGEWDYSGIDPRYRDLWDRAEKYWDCLMGAEIDGDRVVLTLIDAADSAVVALQANYRIGKAEVGALGLLNNDTCRSVMEVVVDYQTVAEYCKKKEQDTPPES